MAHVFISYSREDYEFVQRLTTDLQAAGITLYIDKVGLKPGTTDWEQALRDAIDDAQAVLLIASPDSRKSPYVRDELAIAKAKGKIIYPVWVKGEVWIDSIPMGLGHTQFVDARGEAYTTGLQQLVNVVHGEPVTLANTGQFEAEKEPPSSDLTAPPRNPYKGLEPFRAKDKHDFFGRSALVAELVDTLRTANDGPRFLAVIGPSGSGKSSVVMAGLLPALQEGALEGSREWVYLEPVIPGAHPIENLVVALSRVLPTKSHPAIQGSLNAPTTRGLHMLGQELIMQSGGRVVLYVDQFEEIFTLTQKESERQQFINLLTTAACEPNGPVIVLLTIRADFYDRPMQHHAELGALMESHGKAVLPMSLADLYDVVREPTQLPDVRLEFDEGLVTELVFAVRDEIGGLPLLQFTLDQLFQRREDHKLTRTAYEQIGGVRGALARHAEATFAALETAEHRELARMLFLRLIEPGATEQDTTRRRAAFTELILPDPDQTRILRETADAFVTARLLTSGDVAGQPMIEVSHEALIREWDRLGNWVHYAREDVITQHNVNEDAAAWIARGRKPDDDGLYRGAILLEKRAWVERSVPSEDEMTFIEASIAHEQMLQAEEETRQRRERKLELRAARVLRVLVIALFIFSLVAVGLAYIGLTNAEEADANARRAESSFLGFAANDLMEREDAFPETAVLLGIRGLKQAYSTEADIALGKALDQHYLRYRRSFPSFHLDDVHFTGTDLNVSIRGRVESYGSAPYEWEQVTYHWDPVADELTPANRLFPAPIDTPRDQISGYFFSPDGSQLLTSGPPNIAELWDVATGDRLMVFSDLTGPVYDVEFSLFGNYIALSVTGENASETKLYICDTTDWQRLKEMTINGNINNVDFSPDGEYFAVGYRWSENYSYDDNVVLYNLTTDEFHEYDGSIEGIDSAFSADGRTMIISNYSGVDLWDVESGTSTRGFTPPRSRSICSAAMSPDAERVVIGHCSNGPNPAPAFFMDFGQSRLSRSFWGHPYDIVSVDLSPDGAFFLTVDDHNNLFIWEVSAGSRPERLLSGAEYISKVFALPDQMVVAVTAFGEVFVIDQTTTEIVNQFTMTGGSIAGAAVFDDFQKLIVDYDERSYGDGSYQDYQVFDLASDELLLSGQAEAHSRYHWYSFNTVAISQDEQSAFFSSIQDRPVVDLTTGRTLAPIDIGEGAISSAYSPDGTTVLAGYENQPIIRMWDIKTGELLREFTGHSGVIYDVTYSPDGKLIASASGDHTAVLWDAETGEGIRQFSGHIANVYSVEFSPDGKRLLTGSADGTARLWDVKTGETLRVFTGDMAGIRSAAFTLDGTHIITGDELGVVRVWPIDYRQVIEYACSLVTRDLTDAERRQFNTGDDPSCD